MSNTLKKFLISLFIFVFLLLLNSTVFAEERSFLLNDVSTLNFREKVKSIPLFNIKKMCSYEYCDYVNLENVNLGIEEFSKKYIATISDAEVQKTLMVKGIKITKLILYN